MDAAARVAACNSAPAAEIAACLTPDATIYDTVVPPARVIAAARASTATATPRSLLPFPRPSGTTSRADDAATRRPRSTTNGS